jgi:nanoRNase/pAp phosphatase (c-di-AMP/oligoRNAs hydrolase)
MAKKDMGLLERSLAARRILAAVLPRDCFLLLGHGNPDDDCIASLVAVGLLLKKLHKQAHVYFGGDVHEHFDYLLSICRYNQIGVLAGPGPATDRASAPGGESAGSRAQASGAAAAPPRSLCRFDTVIICDTPKPQMIDAPAWARPLLSDPAVLRIEIDHHLGADSDYCGDPGYRFVTEASSASELVGRLALVLRRRRDVLLRYQIKDLFSRNFVLAVLTGIIGDSRMGQFLKSRRERRYYRRFSAMFNRLLGRQTVQESNLADMEQVFHELQKLSASEQKCFEFFLSRKRRSPSVSWVALGTGDMGDLGCDPDTTVQVARAVTDFLAEESGRLGLVAYYDEGGLAQFRLRRSKDFKVYDLREVLSLFGIRNGGGHEGAIGFRFPAREVPDIEAKTRELIDGIERILQSARAAR